MRPVVDSTASLDSTLDLSELKSLSIGNSLLLEVVDSRSHDCNAENHDASDVESETRSVPLIWIDGIVLQVSG